MLVSLSTPYTLLPQSNSKAALQPVVSAAWFNGKAVTGTVSGHLYVWNGTEIETIVKAHDETVNSLFVAGSSLVSGGKDGKVNSWNASFGRLSSLDAKGRAVRSVASADGGASVRYLLLCKHACPVCLFHLTSRLHCSSSSAWVMLTLSAWILPAESRCSQRVITTVNCGRSPPIR